MLQSWSSILLDAYICSFKPDLHLYSLFFLFYIYMWDLYVNGMFIGSDIAISILNIYQGQRLMFHLQSWKETFWIWCERLMVRCWPLLACYCECDFNEGLPFDWLVGFALDGLVIVYITSDIVHVCVMNSFPSCEAVHGKWALAFCRWVCKQSCRDFTWWSFVELYTFIPVLVILNLLHGTVNFLSILTRAYEISNPLLWIVWGV